MSIIQKTEIIKQVQDSIDIELDNRQVTKVVEAFLDKIKENLSNKEIEKIAFKGFGSFNAINAKGRTGRNPQNGKEVKIPAKRKVKFLVGKEFKDMVNN